MSHSLSTQEPSPQGLFFKNDGKKIFIIGLYGLVFEYDLTTAWDISTIVYYNNFFNSSSFDDNLNIRDLFFWK